jgi:hypothetical protein
MKAYSLDLRQRVLSAAPRGDRTNTEAAELFGVGMSFVNKMLRLRRAGSGLTLRPHGGGHTARHHKLHRFSKEELAMTVLRLVLLISLVALTARGQQNSPQKPSTPSRPVPPASCPVTAPPANPFTPPGLYKLDEDANSFRLGTEKLWTELRKSGVWYWAPHAPGHEHQVQPLTEKIFWGSVDFNWRKEYPPGLKVTGRRLDGDAPPLLTLPTTNAFVDQPTAAMLTGVYVPTPGCWEITGVYKGQKLSFVVWVQPVRQANQ